MHKDLFSDYIFNTLLVIGSDWMSSWGNACKYLRWFQIENNLNIYTVCIVLKKIIAINEYIVYCRIFNTNGGLKSAYKSCGFEVGAHPLWF